MLVVSLANTKVNITKDEVTIQSNNKVVTVVVVQILESRTKQVNNPEEENTHLSKTSSQDPPKTEGTRKSPLLISTIAKLS